MIKKLPLVTVGVPTYSRPKLLERALNSIAIQTYKNIEVIVSDNCSPGIETENVVNSFINRIKNLKYIKQTKPIAIEANFFRLLNDSEGVYFMWLADDDEISNDQYIDKLVSVLESNPASITAMANWKLMQDDCVGNLKRMRDYRSNFWLLRALKFIWRSYDDFFYGLHRKDALIRATLPEYWGINKLTQTNKCYPFLMDLVIQGKIIGIDEEDVVWVNHDYTCKNYIPTPKGKRSLRLFRYFIRRVNIYYLYCQKIYNHGGFWTFGLAFLVSSASLAREFLIYIINWLSYRIKLIL